MEDSATATTLERPPDSRLEVEQPRRGYRYNQDPFHLARFIARHQQDWRSLVNGEIIDLGTGVGILPLLLAEKLTQARFTGIELQEELARLARGNCHRNQLEDRIDIIHADYREFCRRSEYERRFAMVISNPPYYPPADGRLNRCPQKSLARHEIAGNLDDLLAAAAFCLRPAGVLALVFPAERLSELLGGLRPQQLEAKILQFVHPRSSDRAAMLLLAARKNGAGGLIVESPIFI